MYFAMGVEPTNDTAFTRGWTSSASTASFAPSTIWKTPSGMPLSMSSSAQRAGVIGTFSDGLRMKVLPQARANGYIHIGTMPGKLNGVMPAQTPMGSRTVRESMPRDTSLSESPIIRLGMPQATSTIWMARFISMRASSSVLPFSRLRMRRQFIDMLVEERFVPVERLYAVDNGSGFPRRVGGMRFAHGLIDVLGRSVGYVRNLFARCRIKDRMCFDHYLLPRMRMT